MIPEATLTSDIDLEEELESKKIDQNKKLKKAEITLDQLNIKNEQKRMELSILRAFNAPLQIESARFQPYLTDYTMKNQDILDIKT